ncbi:MAG: hypothetical protein JNJ57_18600 [Saprospiraceae bacterium]|nr:hypothetical protein [Saprospiraceae bacterium]
MKVKLLLFSAFITLLSCEKPCEDCNSPKGDYSNGVFVVNEGPWGGSGTITWYNPDTGEFRDSIYEKANNGASLGLFVQSLTFHNGKGYIVVNGANRIVVVDGDTFEYLDTIGGLSKPRYFQAVDNRLAFVSQWGADGLTGSVAAIDLDFNEIIKTYPIGHGPEKMLYFQPNNTLFVANSGGFGVDSTIVSIQGDSDSIIVPHVIPGQKNPACMSKNMITGGFTPWNVLCKGDWNDPNPAGWIGRPFEHPVLGESISGGCDDLATSLNGVDYFTTGTEIRRVLADGRTEKVLTTPAYGFNIHPVTGQFYCADAKDFNSKGTVTIMRPDGSVDGVFKVGISPGEIVFK